MTRSQPGEQALIIDAGGGTIDISTYKVLSNGPLQVEELYEPKCESDLLQWHVSSSKRTISGFVQGGELVTVRATEMIKGMHKHSIRRQIAQPATREIEGLEIQHLGRHSIVLPEVRRRGEEGVFDFEQACKSIHQVWVSER